MENNSIQNNRWSAITAVLGKVNTNGSYKFDVNPSDIPRFLQAALGQMSSADIGTPANGTVYQHTVDHACRVQSMTIEQGKGELCDDPLLVDGQKYSVSRAFGCLIDSIKISGSDSILESEIAIKAYGVFETAKLISNESPEGVAKTITAFTWASGIGTGTATAH